MSAQPIHVAFIEDNSADAELEARELRRAGLRVEHRIVETEEGFRRVVAEFRIDVILSDFSMPGFDGMAALALARELCPDTPFIFVSGTLGEEYAIRALKNGATDYVLKTNLVRLPAAVERALQDRSAAAARKRAEEALRESEERFRGILEGAADGIAVVDAAGRLHTINPQFSAIFGYQAAELAGAQITALIPPELHAGHAGHFARYFAAPHGRRMTGSPIVGLRKDGSRVDLDISLSPMKAREATVVICIVRDVTEQMNQRRHLARLSRIREFVSGINSALVRQRERDALFGEICRIAVAIGKFTGAHVGLLDTATLELKWLASSGTGTRWRTGTASKVTAREDHESGRGVIGASLRTAAAAVWNDVAQDPGVRDRELLLASGIRALASFPLVVEGRAIGVLCLDAAEANFFDSDETRLLQEVSANISFALELIAKQDRLAFLALYDPLTALPNRTLLRERLTSAIDAAGRSGGRLALAIYDLERFKAINDTFGQPIGDKVLQAVAQRVLRPVKDVNRVARLGSNLFALVIPGVNAAEELARDLERAAARFFAAPFEIEGRELRLAAKAGVAVYPDHGADADSLFRNAEAALEQAKETGERQVFYAAAINARVAEQVELENRLRQAVERDELFLHYQPKLDLVTRRIVGLEALMRWQPPGQGLVPPAKFVPILEQTGLILEAGRQVLALASATYCAWKARGIEPPRIAVNVSALQLRRKSFVEDVRAALGDGGAHGGGVDLEITESLLMSDVDESIGKLRELRDMGMLIALDDFGTGYSSLAYLSKLPLDTLKIDRGFVRGMTENAGDASIISAIIALAKGLRLKVVAEGVETEEQAQLLTLLCCDQAQGYLFSPPVPAERIEEMLKAL